MKALVFQATFLFLLVLSSCKVTEENLVGVYYLKAFPKTKLLLRQDKTFEFVKNIAKPGINIFNEPVDLNFRTTGSWQLDQHRTVLLTSSNVADKSSVIWDSQQDTALQNSNITTFSFWDQYGDPIVIHFIKFLTGRVKFHLNNNISFFNDDLHKAGTMEFYFNGYLPYIWPEKLSANKKDHSTYKIILYEQNRPGFFENAGFIARKGKLINEAAHFVLIKSQ